MMRAKMKVQSVETFEGGMQKVKMSAVCGDKPFGPAGESEDNTFARYTPSGSIELSITNPDLAGQLVAGQKLYVDFILAE